MLNHRGKVKLAKNLRTQDEEIAGVGMFASERWQRRKWETKQNIKRRETRRKYHKEVKQGLR